MTVRLGSERLELRLRDPFRIARTDHDESVTTLVVHARLGEEAGESVRPAAPGGGRDDQPFDGIGEAFPVRYYGETPATIEAVLPLLEQSLEPLGAPPADTSGTREWLATAAAAMDGALGYHGGAKCAVDIALHDLAARRLGVPLHELLGMPRVAPPTDFSLGLDEPAVVAERARRAAGFRFLKIKVGGPADLETLEAVRSVFAGPIRIDANTGWEPHQVARLLPELERLGVELIEQPFPAHEHAQLRWLQERSSLPIVADESAINERDLERLVGVVAGVNVKLTKCGGIGPARAMLERGRELGFKLMLGCMQETSVGIAAAAVLASLADWVDLDGNLLLADDPFEGLELADNGRWQLSDASGLGVRRRA